MSGIAKVLIAGGGTLSQQAANAFDGTLPEGTRYAAPPGPPAQLHGTTEPVGECPAPWALPAVPLDRPAIGWSEFAVKKGGHSSHRPGARTT